MFYRMFSFDMNGLQTSKTPVSRVPRYTLKFSVRPDLIDIYRALLPKTENIESHTKYRSSP